jgi:serine/threonine-protein kinase
MPALPEIGTVFAEKYVIESELGSGAAGVVFSATHRELRHRVAIKVLKQPNAVAAERMIREARAAIAVQSEHVVRVMDVGREKGLVYLVMEQLDGADLAHTLRQRGPLPVTEAVDYVLQTCAGVAEAHARGIVHRDLKPSNLFLTHRADGSALVKVLDFGISKTTNTRDSEVSLTGSAEVIGSPMYMSPEQVRGANLVDHRSDIWSLGIILYRFLTGKAPFGSGMPVSGALASIVSDPLPSLREDRPEVPGALEAVVRRCLTKAATERFATVTDLAAALAPFGSDDGRVAVARLVRDRVLLRARRPRWPIVVAGGVALAAVPTVLVALHRGHGDTDAAAAPPTVSVAPSAAPQAPPPPSASASTSSTTSSSADAPAPPRTAPPPSPVAPVRRAVPRLRPPSNASVVRSAATDDRY